MRHAALVLSALLVVPALCADHAQAQQPIRSEIDIDVVDMDLAKLMDDIGRQAGVNIVVHPDVHERVTVALRRVSWRDAVRVIARLTRCKIQYYPGHIMGLSKPPRVSMQCQDANVRTVLMQLAEYAGANIILASDVQGTITMDLRDVDYKAAMHAVVKTIAGGKFTIVNERSYNVGGDPQELAKNEPAPEPAHPAHTLQGRLVKLGEKTLKLETEEGKVIACLLPEDEAMRKRVVETLEDAPKGSRLVLTVIRVGKRYVVTDMIAQSR